MGEQEEALLVIAVYAFVVIVSTLPFLITYLFIRISRTIKRANKVIEYLYEAETEARKYH